VTLW